MKFETKYIIVDSAASLSKEIGKLLEDDWKTEGITYVGKSFFAFFTRQVISQIQNNVLAFPKIHDKVEEETLTA